LCAIGVNISQLTLPLYVQLIEKSGTYFGS
jgi:hypothetical protein